MYPLNHIAVRCSNLLDRIHSDVCGPFNTSTIGGAKFFVPFIDDYSRWCEVYLMKSEAEVLEKFIEYKNLVENSTGRKIKQLQSDNGREYCNERFDKFLAEHGISRRLSAPHTQQQNGLAERKYRTLIEAVRCMLTSANLEKHFWGEALMTANHLRNRSSTVVLNFKTPYHYWNGKTPNLKYLRIFGCIGYVLDKTQKPKLQAKSLKGYMVGYSDASKAYRIWVPELRRIVISRDVKFINEDKYNVQINHEPKNDICNEFEEGGSSSDMINILDQQESESINPEPGNHDPQKEKNIQTGVRTKN